MPVHVPACCFLEEHKANRSSITISLMAQMLALPFLHLDFQITLLLFFPPLDSCKQKVHSLSSIKTEIAEDQ